MERDTFGRIRRILRRLGRRRRNGRFTYTDATILEVYLWAVINDRPVGWACVPEHWPPGLRRGPLPSHSVVSRRMRSPQVQRLFARLRRHAGMGGSSATLAIAIDAKPLPIASHSHDRQAGYGRAAGGKAKGYKLHAIVSLDGRLLVRRVTPMNKDERTIARRMLRELEHTGYLLADGNYDSNPLFDAAKEHGLQLVAPRRYGSDKGLGHHRHSAARLRCRDLLENTISDFGRELHHHRQAIERFFGTLTSAAGGLTCLPAWVRGIRRVRDWVDAKILCHHLRHGCKRT
jgi:hypothetical protein